MIALLALMTAICVLMTGLMGAVWLYDRGPVFSASCILIQQIGFTVTTDPSLYGRGVTNFCGCDQLTESP